jgi:hypothetical protein
MSSSLYANMQVTSLGCSFGKAGLGVDKPKNVRATHYGIQEVVVPHGTHGFGARAM